MHASHELTADVDLVSQSPPCKHFICGSLWVFCFVTLNRPYCFGWPNVHSNSLQYTICRASPSLAVWKTPEAVLCGLFCNLSRENTHSPRQTLALGGTSVYHCTNGALCNACGRRHYYLFTTMIISNNTCWRRIFTQIKEQIKMEHFKTTGFK